MITFPTLPDVRMTSPFGWRTHPVTGVRTFHHGTDFAPAVPGTTGVPIYATQDGTVVRVTTGTTEGLYIRIQHTADSYTSQYLHLASAYVSVNDAVVSGDLIGIMGMSGRVTGIHLDFGVSTVNPPVYGSPGTFIDPQGYLAYAADPDETEPPNYAGTAPFRNMVYVRKNRIMRRNNR